MPLSDGGQWNMAVNLIKKHGLVPKSVMPETESSSNTPRMNSVLTYKLREGARDLREAAARGVELDALRRAAEPLREGAKSQLIVSGATEQERRRALLADAARDVFDEGFVRATATRLRETAYGLWRADRGEDARDCLAAAAVFEERGADQPVAEAFAEVWFGPLFEQLAREEESADEESVLVKP